MVGKGSERGSDLCWYGAVVPPPETEDVACWHMMRRLGLMPLLRASHAENGGDATTPGRKHTSAVYGFGHDRDRVKIRIHTKGIMKHALRLVLGIQ